MSVSAEGFVDIGAVDEFPIGGHRTVMVGRLEVWVLRRSDGEFHAVHNRCPHQGAPICFGSVGPKMVGGAGGPGIIQSDQAQLVITCPWHHWEFSVESGRAVWDERYRLRIFETISVGGRLQIRLRRAVDVPAR